MLSAKRALVVIDIQNDYFPCGKFPLWNAEEVLKKVESAITKAHAQHIPVVLIQHVSDNPASPFLVKGTPGVLLHSAIIAAAPEAKVIEKKFADAFYGTVLDEILAKMGVEELLVCGMMTQNCVTHTAISKAAEKYRVSLLADCSTTVSEILHKIALNAVSTRLSVVQSSDVQVFASP
jgi:nicotinamidase-related amidase